MKNVTVAIGDIHGHLAEFQCLLDFMKKEYTSFKLITLGDYIDRGPDSAGVIESLIDLHSDPKVHLIPLMGNHESLAVDSLIHGSASSMGVWMKNGGVQCLNSYKDRFGESSDGMPIVPDDHLRFLSSLEYYHDDGKRFFVHAGVDPWLKSTTEQRNEVMLWIRDPFLKNQHCLDRVVVHGHTPKRSAPKVYDWRINLDAGVFSTGVLAAAVFNDNNDSKRVFRANTKTAQEVLHSH